MNTTHQLRRSRTTWIERKRVVSYMVIKCCGKLLQSFEKQHMILTECDAHAALSKEERVQMVTHRCAEHDNELVIEKVKVKNLPRDGSHCIHMMSRTPEINDS